MKIIEIENHIKERCFDKSFNVESLSEELQVSESYLREIININYHCSPHHLIETIRLEKAIRLLADYDMNIYSVCANVGYANLKTFRQAFKRRTGMSPKEFKGFIKQSNNVKGAIENTIECLWRFSSPKS